MDLWDVIQHFQIQHAEESASLSRKESVRVDDRLQQESQRLEAKVDALALVCEALWELMSEKTDLQLEDIRQKMDEIDQRDGRRDGKITGKPALCKKCHRPVHTKQQCCMYCGEPLGEGYASGAA